MWIRPSILHTRDVGGDSGGRQTAAAPTQVPARVIIKSKHWRGDLVHWCRLGAGCNHNIAAAVSPAPRKSFIRQQEGRREMSRSSFDSMIQFLLL